MDDSHTSIDDLGVDELPAPAADPSDVPESTPDTSANELRGWYSAWFALTGYFMIFNFAPLLAQSCALVASGYPGVCGNIIHDPGRINAVFHPSPSRDNVTSMYYLAGFVGLECEDATNPECIGDYCRGVPTSTSDCRLADGTTLQPLRAGPGIDPTSFATISIAVATMAQVRARAARPGAPPPETYVCGRCAPARTSSSPTARSSRLSAWGRSRTMAVCARWEGGWQRRCTRGGGGDLSPPTRYPGSAYCSGPQSWDPWPSPPSLA